MSGFPPTCFHCANLAICARAPKFLPPFRGLSRIARAHDRRSRLRHRLDARALAPHLPALQNGKLVDNDLDLLVRAADVFHPAPGVTTT